jgi:hypothetical protein
MRASPSARRVACWVRSGPAWASVERALERAVDGGGGRVELLRDLAGREAEDIAQDQHRALRGHEVLQGGDERQLDALAFLVACLRRQWVGLQPQRLAKRLAGTGVRLR